jgi:hypothetical protein
MTHEQDEAVFSAYLGICVLKTLCRKAKLELGEQRSGELLVELDTAFPGLSGRAALRAPVSSYDKD